MLINKQDVVFEASIEMRFEPQLYNDWIMVTVDMSIYPVKALEKLANEGGKQFGKWNTWKPLLASPIVGLFQRSHQFC